MKKLQIENVIAICDSREQLPLKLKMPTATGTLTTGDYSLMGLDDLICGERKSLSDLIGCMTSGRDRFERELHRMKAYPHKLVVVEAHWIELVEGNYRSQLNPASATHSVLSWMGKYQVPFLFAGSHELACDAVSFYMFSVAKRLHERLETLSKKVVCETS